MIRLQQAAVKRHLKSRTSSCLLLSDGGGEKETLPESCQTFEVAEAHISEQVNLVSSRQTGFSRVRIRLLKNRWLLLSPLDQAHGC